MSDDLNRYCYHLAGPHGEYTELISLSTQVILRCAEEHGIQWEAIPGTHILKLSKGRLIKYFCDQISPLTSYVGYHICIDKEDARQFLRAAGISVPNGVKLPLAASPTLLRQTYRSLKRPLVVKPSHGAKGVSVTTDIRNFESFQQAFKAAKKLSMQDYAGVMVEEQFKGIEYRVLATRRRVIGIIQRIPANVTGDGVSTIAELIEKKNAEPGRGDPATQPLGIIEIDRDLQRFLRLQKLKLSDVPREGKKIFVRGVSNISRGGDSIDMTNVAHPSVKKIALQAMRAIPELGLAGIDVMTTDIRAKQTSSTYTIIEVNASPGISIHDFPYEGTPRNTGLAFLQLLFPELKSLKTR